VTLALTSTHLKDPTATYATAGDTVTLGITTNDPYIPATGLSVLIDGHAVSATGSGGVYTASWSLAASDPSGSVTYSVTAVNQVGISSETSTSGAVGAVTVDNHGVVVGSPTFHSTNATSARWAKAGDTITLTFDSGDRYLSASGVSVQLGTRKVPLSGIAVDPTTGLVTVTWPVLASDPSGELAYSIAVTNPVDVTAGPVTSGAAGTVSIDNNPLGVNSPSFVSNNGTSASWARSGDTITLTFDSGDKYLVNTGVTVQVGSTTLPNSAINVNPANGVVTAVYTVTGADTGVQTYSVSAVNPAGTTLAATSPVCSVTVDNFTPVLASGTLLSSNTTTGWAKAGDTLTLRFTLNDPYIPLANVSVAIAGHPASTTLSGGTFTATYVLNAQDASGSVGYSVAAMTPSGTSATLTTGASGSVTVDNYTLGVGSPVFASNNPTSTAWAKAGNTITLTFQSGDKYLVNTGVTVQVGSTTLAHDPVPRSPKEGGGPVRRGHRPGLDRYHLRRLV
jgi:hypothetical protein